MLHIQVVLYNSIKNLEKFIKGFDTVFEENNDFIIHFLENSSEESQKFIESKKPKFQYTFKNSNENLGFGRGHNFLFQEYKKDYDEYFMILNPDTLPFYNFIEEFEKFIGEISKKNWGIIELTQFLSEHPKEFTEDFKTEWAHGAATVFRTKDFEELKGFDENIFMYCEDVDISWRVKELGKEIYTCPRSKVAHITQNLDLEKENTFERVNSFAGGLYLRFKYFGENEAEDYKDLIRGAGKDFVDAVSLFDDMKLNLTKEDLEKYRKFKSPQIYQDGNYAKHRW